MKIVNKFLEEGEYFKEVFPKDTIYLHHTAGSHRPDWVIDGWERDRAKNGGKLPVGTAYVIGGVSTTDGNADFDGVIYCAFPDQFWAHGLGLKQTNNELLNKKSIQIEICNYGPLIKTKEGIYLNYVNKPVPESMVCKLSKPFRGFTYYHSYTDKQLEALKELLNMLSTKYKINLKEGLQLFIKTGADALEVNSGALKGVKGVWSHSSVRSDKFDVSPTEKMLNFIQNL